MFVAFSLSYPTFLGVLHLVVLHFGESVSSFAIMTYDHPGEEEVPFKQVRGDSPLCMHAFHKQNK